MSQPVNRSMPLATLSRSVARRPANVRLGPDSQALAEIMSPGGQDVVVLAR